MKIMLQTVSILAVILLATTRLTAQEDVSQSKWQADPIVIDGEDTEWNPPFNLFDNKSGLMFTISNDKKNIYLCFTDIDKLKAEKMMKAGWSIELSSSEKKRKFDVSIGFAKADDPNINMRTDFTDQVGIYKADITTVKTKGFVSNNGDLPLVNKGGLLIGIGTDAAQKIVYEMEIPIRELMPEDKLELNELLTLTVTVNALGNPASGGGGFSGGGRTGGGGRMGGGGGRRGGGASGSPRENTGSADREALVEKARFKQKFRLANK